MIRFIFRCLFFLDILFVGLLYTARFPKRSHYFLRVVGVCVIGTLVSCTWGSFFDGRPETLGAYLLYESVSFLGNYLIALLCVYLCVDMRPWTCMYMGTLFWFTQQSSHSVASLLSNRDTFNAMGIVTSVASILVIAILMYALLIRKIDASLLERIKRRMVFPNWVLMLVACLFLNSYAGFYGESSRTYYLSLFLIDTVVMFYQYSIYVSLGLERENEAVRLLLEQSGKQYQISKQNMEQINIKCHDLRHQINVFRSEGRIDESVSKAMEQVVDDYDTTVKTGNAALDVLLTEKSQLCHSMGIGFTCMADGKGLTYMEPGDLYALFGNALENAIEATQQLTDPAQQQIVLTVRTVAGFCHVHLQNYAKDRLVLENGLPVTSKQDHVNHGLGTRSMQLLVEKYGGELSFQQDEDVVDTYMLLPCRPAKAS